MHSHSTDGATEYSATTILCVIGIRASIRLMHNSLNCDSFHNNNYFVLGEGLRSSSLRVRLLMSVLRLSLCLSVVARLRVDRSERTRPRQSFRLVGSGAATKSAFVSLSVCRNHICLTIVNRFFMYLAAGTHLVHQQAQLVLNSLRDRKPV